jgi:MFS family permease
MMQTATASMLTNRDTHKDSEGLVVRSLVIGLTAFLTVVDLFATQAILPSLARHYDVTPAAMGFAVNASTMGMAVAGLAVGFFSQRIDRRLGILVSLALLSVPTVLLASAPNLTVFTGLRICQGLCMASAFILTLAYLGEHFSAADAGTAFAAYITGNVASSLRAVLLGLVLIGIGTFLAQAIATGFVGRAATSNRGAASGLYLASYFFGGLVGSAALGQLFDRLGWAACVAGIGAALAVAAMLACRLETSAASGTRKS